MRESQTGRGHPQTGGGEDQEIKCKHSEKSGLVLQESIGGRGYFWKGKSTYAHHRPYYQRSRTVQEIIGETKAGILEVQRINKERKGTVSQHQDGARETQGIRKINFYYEARTRQNQHGIQEFKGWEVATPHHDRQILASGAYYRLTQGKNKRVWEECRRKQGFER